MTKILVMSDVHGNTKLIEKILNKNKDVDIKIFCGDFEISKQEQEIYSKEFDYVVTGNCDYDGISEEQIIFNIEGKNILLVHGHYFGTMFKKIDFDYLFKKAKENNCEVILHGHDHISEIEKFDGITRLNPGSIWLPRNTEFGTYAIITIKNGNWIFEHIKC